MTVDRKHIKPSDVVFLQDTREKLPLDFSAFVSTGAIRVEKATLDCGDYSVRGLTKGQGGVCVERKSVTDLIMCVGREKDRFERELQRMLAYTARLIVVDGTWAQIMDGMALNPNTKRLEPWRSQIVPAQVYGSVARWQTIGMSFMFLDGAQETARYVANFMYLHAVSSWATLRAFNDTIRIAGDKHG